jgi:xylan 1,4-beta-xylosidase
MSFPSPRGLYTLLATLIALPFSVAQTPSSAVDSNPPPILIAVHADRSTGPYTPIWNFFGADEPNYLYAPNGKKLLGHLAALSPAPVYFRPHNLLTTGDGAGSLKWGSTNVYTEQPDGSPVYNFAITDRIFDALTAAHVRPIVEIGFMPEALSAHPQPYRHSFPDGDIFTGWSYPPKDESAWRKWSALVTAYATHLRDRYGAQTDTWLWEVWNEPDIPYWHGTPAEYDRLYDLTANAIRRVLPHSKIGGPEATGVSDHSEPFLRQFLEHCAHGVNAATGAVGAPLDFISYHPKGHPEFVDGHVSGAPDDRSSSAGWVVMSISTQLRAVERGMRVIASYPEWRNTPIILGESDPEGCGACLSARNGYRNSPLYGASVTEATLRTYELARKYNLTVQGAVTWAFEFEDQPAFAQLRALATDGIDKPVLNAFRLMGMLGAGPAPHRSLGNWLAVESSGALPLDQVVEHSVTGAPDVNAVATRNGSEVDILLWNYHDANVAAPPAQIRLSVDGIQSASARESEFRMDATHSNATRVWLEMGSPAKPSPVQLSGLEKAGSLEQTSPDHAVAVHAGKLDLALTLPRDGLLLVRLREPSHEPRREF